MGLKSECRNATSGGQRVWHVDTCQSQRGVWLRLTSVNMPDALPTRRSVLTFRLKAHGSPYGGQEQEWLGNSFWGSIYFGTDEYGKKL